MDNDGTMTTTEILFALLRSEICDDKNAFTLKALDEEALNKLYRVAKAHDVANIVSDALYKQGLLGDTETSKRFLDKQLKSVYRSEQQKYCLNEISSAFQKERIPYIALKGAVLRPLYPEEWMRTSCDIDVLIQDEDISRAVEVLVAEGFKTDNKRDYHDISLFSPSGVHLELHFNIKENMDGIDELLAKAWDFSQRDGEDSYRYSLTNEFFVFHHIAHMAYHFVNGGCGIKPFVDLCIIKDKMSYDDAVVRDYCRLCKIEKFYDNVLTVLDVWFKNATPTPLSLQIESYILRGGVYGTVENRVIVAQGKQNGRSNYILSRLFMPYDTLKNYFPILEKHKWLLPFMQVRRWFRFLFKGKLKRGVFEVKVNQNVSKDKVLEMNEFLKNVGL